MFNIFNFSIFRNGIWIIRTEDRWLGISSRYLNLLTLLAVCSVYSLTLKMDAIHSSKSRCISTRLHGITLLFMVTALRISSLPSLIPVFLSAFRSSGFYANFKFSSGSQTASFPWVCQTFFGVSALTFGIGYAVCYWIRLYSETPLKFNPNKGKPFLYRRISLTPRL
jgi:hypothetical protein